MKKFLGILVLGLLISTNAYLACDKEDFVKYVPTDERCISLVNVGKIDKLNLLWLKDMAV